MVTAAAAAWLFPTQAATLDINFDSDPSAFFEKTGGTDNGNGTVGPEWRTDDGNPSTGGYLKITDAVDSQAAALVFKDADAGKIVTGFTFTCDVRIGNDFGDANLRGADGFSISFARASDPFLATDPLDTSKLAAGLPEAGTTTGLAISFDAWSGNVLPDGGDREGIIVRLDNRTIGGVDLATRNGLCADQSSLQTGPNDGTGTTAPLCWQPLSVTLGTDGKLTVSYKGRVILNGFQTGFVPSPGRLVFAGRTGGNNQIQHVDNLKLTTTVSTTPIVSGLSLVGFNGLKFQIFDSGDSIADPATVVVKNGATTLSPTIEKVGDTITVTYAAPTAFASGSTQTLTIDYKDTNGTAIPTVTRSVAVPTYAGVYSIGMNFGASEPLVSGHLVDPNDSTVLAGLAPNDVAGLAAIAQADWNNMVDLNDRANTGANGTMTGVQVFNKGSFDTSSDTYVEWHSNGTWTSTATGTVHTENNNNFPAGSNDRILMTAYLDTGNATTTRITVTNLPGIYSTNGYDVYVYALGGVSGRGGAYRITDLAGNVIKQYQFGDSPASANPTVYVQDPGVSHSDTGNYLKFSGLVARDIIIEATTENGLGLSGTPRAPVNAVQLVAGNTALTAPVVGEVAFTPSQFLFTITDVPAAPPLDPTTVTVKLDGASTNIPVRVTKTNDITYVFYDIIADKHQFFAVSGHTNLVSLNGGAGIARTFTVAAYTTVDARTALPFDAGDATKPGFRARLHGYDSTAFIRGPGDRNQTIIAERALNNGYFDPATGDAYTDIFAAAAGTDAEGYFDVAGPINFNFAGGDAGFFTSANSYPEETFPGPLDSSSVNFEIEFVGYLKLPLGFYRFAVNSDDGFRFSIAPGQDAVGGQILGQFNGGRGVGVPSFFDFAIPQDGVYPVRLSYWQGTGGESIEFYVQDILTGERHLVNASETGAISAFRAAANARPSIRRALPVQNWIGGYANDDVIIESKDDPSSPVKVDATSVKLFINGNAQTTDVTVTKDDTTGVTKLVRKGSLSNLLYSGVNTIRYVRSFTGDPAGTLTFTNQYDINVAPYYGVIPAAYKVDPAQIDTSKIGFHAYVDQMDKTKDANQGNGGRISGNGGDGNRLPRPEQQLAGSELSTATGARFPNLAQPGPNNDWTYDFTLFNFRSPLDGAAGVGMITQTAPPTPNPGAQTDDVMPGLPGTGTSNSGVDNYVMEATTYLDLKKGVYVFGVNSDDGFLVNAGADPHDTLGQMLGFANIGRGNSGNLVGPTGTSPYNPTPGTSNGSTPFNVIVPEDGIYPIRILYWQGGGGVNAEFIMLNKDSGQVVLVNDTASATWVPTAYSGYTGPARPWTRFSVSPTPWDNAVQQAGPDSLQIWARTPTQVNSADILNETPVWRPFANVGIGGVVANAATENVRILLDGNDVTANADITPNGTDKKVVYQPGKGTNPLLASGSTHTASLVYAGGTNSWTFRVGPYVTVPDTNRMDVATVNAADRGFKVRVAQGPDTPALANTVARAEAQLAGTPASISTPGPEADGSYILTNGVINFSIDRNAPRNGAETGNFESITRNALASWPYGDRPDQPFPGLVPQTAANNLQNFSMEVIGYLQFDQPGFYRFGANGDDGWRIQVGTNLNLTAVNQSGPDTVQTNPNVLFSIDRGAGNRDIPFGFVIPAAGIYPMRVVYYQGGGGGNFEVFSYDPDVTGGKILLNDPTNPKAIKSYFRASGGVQPAPQITVTSSGGNITITWTNGGELLTATDVAGPWTTTGDTSGSHTEPIGTGNKFFQIRRSQ